MAGPDPSTRGIDRLDHAIPDRSGHLGLHRESGGVRHLRPEYRILVWLGVLVFAAYIASFGLVFSRGGNMFALLPVFGTGAMLLIWAAALFSLMQLRHQAVVTTVHVLVAGGLLAAAIGVTMGVLIGTEYVVGQFLPLPPGDRVGVHAGKMDTYVLLVASAIVEWFVLKDAAGRWTRPGLARRSREPWRRSSFRSRSSPTSST